jgi:hypothetical protein
LQPLDRIYNFPAEHEHGVGNVEITITSRSLRRPVFDIRDLALLYFPFDREILPENLRGALIAVRVFRKAP